MNFEERLSNEIREECEKLIHRYHSYHNSLHQEYERNCRRLPSVPKKIIKLPIHWSADPKFDPFYVRSRAKSIARSISRKIELGKYVPNSPYIQSGPKSDGGQRHVTIYQIPDAAVSKLFYARLLSKNKHRFSSFSYAYRNDRNVHFAIQDISVDLSQDARSFVADLIFLIFLVPYLTTF